MQCASCSKSSASGSKSHDNGRGSILSLCKGSTPYRNHHAVHRLLGWPLVVTSRQRRACPSSLHTMRPGINSKDFGNSELSSRIELEFRAKRNFLKSEIGTVSARLDFHPQFGFVRASTCEHMFAHASTGVNLCSHTSKPHTCPYKGRATHTFSYTRKRHTHAFFAHTQTVHTSSAYNHIYIYIYM